MRAIHGILAATLLPAAILFLSGCGQVVRLVGSGTIVTESKAIEDFTRIDASHSFKVIVTEGGEFKVSVRADDNVMPHVLVSLSANSDTLELDLKENNYHLQNVTLVAEVTMPKLVALRLSGATNASVSGFESSEAFRARLSGASDLTGDLVAGDVEFTLSGSSSVSVKGSGTNLEVSASGSSSAKLSQFAVTNVEVRASGASWVSIHPSGTLNAAASGASKVVYSGNPTVGKKEVSGSASIRAK